MVGLGGGPEWFFSVAHNGLSEYAFTFLSHEKDQRQQSVAGTLIRIPGSSLFLLHHSQHEASIFKVTHGCHYIHDPGNLKEQRERALDVCATLLKELFRNSSPITSANFPLP